MIGIGDLLAAAGSILFLVWLVRCLNPRLTRCAACREWIAKSAASCPRCGNVAGSLAPSVFRSEVEIPRWKPPVEREGETIAAIHAREEPAYYDLVCYNDARLGEVLVAKCGEGWLKRYAEKEGIRLVPSNRAWDTYRKIGE